MIKVILILIVIGVVAVLSMAAFQPDSFRIERSISINAPADQVFPKINDLHQWRIWSPYENKDPNMKRSFGSITEGPGATYAWEGNSEVGQGKMEITEVQAPSKVTFRLDFLKPMQATHSAEFFLQSEADATRVTWAMSGTSNYLSKVICLFMDMDKMVGKDFEQGLATLKTLSEKGPGA